MFDRTISLLVKLGLHKQQAKDLQSHGWWPKLHAELIHGVLFSENCLWGFCLLFPAKSVKNCILHSFARRAQIKAKACFAKYFYVNGFQSSSAYYYFLCFARHLLFPSDCILNEICLNSVCIVKKKKNDLKGYSPRLLAQVILLPSVIPCTKFFLQRFMGASSIMIKKAIRYLTDVSGHPWHTHEAKA